MVNVTIDGKNIEVPEGTTVLQAARKAGVAIPTLCDHPELTPYGGCRLCLVEVEGARTMQPSCTLPCNNNMVVKTDTPKVKDARKFVLTLIFSERNHFCMYCQKTNGDCELQNCAYAEGMDHWPLQPNWQPYAVDSSHPFYVMDHNRCILCRRCVRACAELVGNFTLGMEERGFNTFLVADLGNPLGESTCVSCGTCVQVCPTGALIDRSSAYQGLEKQTNSIKSICTECSVGCGIEVRTRDNRLVRIDGDWDAEVNGGVLCKAGRFEPMQDKRQRLTTPMIRKDGQLVPATWDEAMQTVTARLGALKGQNGHGVAALASDRLPAESLFLFRELFRGLGSGMVTSLNQGSNISLAANVVQEAGAPIEGTLAALEKADAVLSIGVDLAAEHQVAGFFVKRSVPRGSKLVLVDDGNNALSILADPLLKAAPGQEETLVKGLIAATVQLGLAKTAPQTVLAADTLATVAAQTSVAAADLEQAARTLATAPIAAIIYGAGITSKATLQALVDLSRVTGASLISPKGQANTFAAAQYGLEQAFKLNGQQAVFVALSDEQPSAAVQQQIAKAPFLMVAAAYASEITEKADVVLPVETWAEREGHYLNMEGRLQAAQAALPVPAGAQSTTRTLAQLADLLQITPAGNWKDSLQERTPVAALQLN